MKNRGRGATMTIQFERERRRDEVFRLMEHVDRSGAARCNREGVDRPTALEAVTNKITSTIMGDDRRESEGCPPKASGPSSIGNTDCVSNIECHTDCIGRWGIFERRTMLRLPVTTVVISSISPDWTIYFLGTVALQIYARPDVYPATFCCCGAQSSSLRSHSNS